MVISVAMPRRTRGNGAIELLPSGRFRARYVARDGRHPSRTFTQRRDAETWLRRAIVDSERDGIDVTSRDAFATLFAPWWNAKERSVQSRTADRYREHLAVIRKAPIAKVALRDLDLDQVQAFVDGLSPKYAPGTIHGIYTVLAMIIRHGAARKKLQPIRRPAFPATVKAELTVPSPAQVEQLAEASDRRAYAPVILAGYCGLRQGELLALGWADVHLDEAWLLVRRARNKATGTFGPTKTGTVRRVFLPARVVAALTEHLDEYPGELVVPCSPAVFLKSWPIARKACGLEAVRFHDLRHAAASMMIAAGVDILQVAKQLGHGDAAITLRVYGHLLPESNADAIAKMDAFHDRSPAP